MKVPQLKISTWSVVIFCACYVVVQLFFISNAHFSSDKRFGFWMFAESSIFKAELYRITTKGDRVKTQNGFWTVNEKGKRVVYSWNQFVRDYRLNYLEKEKRAKVSMSITLKFFDAALDYVADQIVDDKETKQLVLLVTYSKACGEEYRVTLESKMRSF